MKIVITRGIDSKHQNLGVLQILDNCNVIYSCAKLELPYLNNKNSISSIPIGTYKAKKYNSPSKGNVLLFEDVPNRTYVEVHSGNFYSDILGCVIVGKSFKDIDKDGVIDVAESRAALNEILAIVPNDIDIEVR